MKIIIGLMFLCTCLVILGIVYIAKWCDKEMDHIMNEELKKRQNIRQQITIDRQS